MLGDQIWFGGQQIVWVYARNTKQNSLLLNNYQILHWTEGNRTEEILESIIAHLRSSKITHP